ncbi:Lcl C-terminal domain-containing protein [Pseudoalteromonas sp. T1lg23B]|uniref:Lcl C-terminal domain-containing protein n=1 Tax=Pseudoalteromonas sp. T1lg23B TaxID=2077097 RepID=UPI000CF67925|nr:DUF1566 domain-containing protein [Pseudoalteromonas sp. T1lg23B]
MKTKLFGTVGVTIAMLLGSSNAVAQICKDNIHASNLAGQYLDNEDGTVTDVINGLIWQKCSIGQTYQAQSNDCLGNPTNLATWQQALQAASNTDAQWRLPNIKELGTLVERKCFDPAINLSVFPSTPSAVYWSNTPDKNLIHQREGTEGRLIDFSTGGEFMEDVNAYRFARLIKTL